MVNITRNALTWMRNALAKGPLWGRIAFSVWLALYLLWFAVAPHLVEAMGRRKEDDYVQFFMLYVSLWPGLGIGILGTLFPRKGMWVLAAIASAVHLILGLGGFS
jgi:hypothetical protein